MNILCPIDFSVASIDAVRYAVAIGEKFPKCKVELLHCIHVENHSRIFSDELNFLESRATVKMQTLISQIEKLNAAVKVNYLVLKGNPRDLVVRHIGENHFDYAVIGAKGLRSARDRAIGSLTEQLFRNAECPVIAVPQSYVFQSLKVILLALDGASVREKKVILPVLSLLKVHNSRLKLLHVRQKDDSSLEYDQSLDEYLNGIDYDQYSKFTTSSVNKAINQVCQEEDADMLCMIHRSRGWITSIFHQSQVKKELFQISMPVLILRD